MEFKFSSFIQFPFSINDPSCIIDHICFDPRNDQILILAYKSFVGVLNTVNNKPENSGENSMKRLKISDTKNETQMFVKTIRTYEHLIHLSWLNEAEMVVTEVNPKAIVEQLAPAFRRKLYGVS